MAKASITYQFPDGGALHIETKVDASYPDALAELEARALSMFKEAWPMLSDEPAP